MITILKTAVMIAAVATGIHFGNLIGDEIKEQRKKPPEFPPEQKHAGKRPLPPGYAALRGLS